MAKFITGLDIGSSRIKVLVAKEGEKNLELVWKYERESEGVFQN
jgi:cell division ATPase FtsA